MLKYWVISVLLLSVGCDVHWMEQPLDHMNSHGGEFLQKYILERESEKGNRLLIYINGEGPCTSPFDKRDFPIRIAEQLDATLIAVEHRFYGSSVPKASSPLSLDQLQHLTIEQALADLVSLIVHLKTQHLHSLHPDTQVISIGGSYSGALSAWLKQSYPFIIKAALASSAVVQPIIDFTQFDQQTGISLDKEGTHCSTYWQTFIQDSSIDIRDKVTTHWGVQYTTREDNDILWMVSDILAMAVQYGHKSILCQAAKQNNNPWQTLKTLLIEYKIDSSASHDRDQLKRVDYSNDYMTSSRQWLYQCCTQVGWFQTPSSYRLRPSSLNIQYYEQLCREVFGIGIQYEAIKEFSKHCKGKDNVGQNIIFTNGGDDQWQWASITQNNTYQHNVIYIDCPQQDCGHCVDLKSPTSTDDNILTNARQSIISTINQWFNTSNS